MGWRAAALGAALAVVAGFSADARAEPITLLSPIAPLRPPPPLFQGGPTTGSAPEVRFLGHLASRELVVVGLARDGSPARVVATQRIAVSRTGDFTFVIPAPATSVSAGPGTEAQPGLRDLGIVWQGFADRRRILSATATLRVAEARAGLPVEVRVVRRGGESVVTFANVTARPVRYASGTAPLAAVQSALARLRADLREARGVAISSAGEVDGTSGGQVATTIVAPLRLHGTVTAPGAEPVVVDGLLGSASPTRTVTVTGRGAPRIDVRVEFLDPLRLLPTPAALAASHNPVAALQNGLATVALTRQFERYLDTPDPVSPSSASYLYRTLRQPIVRSRPPTSWGGGDTLAIVLGATLGAAALLGGVVLWARS